MFWRSLSTTVLLAICLLFGPIISANKKPPPAPVNLNTATSAQLQQVPGIGPSTADKIVQMRKSYGPFKSVNDLLAIRGIGPKKLDKMRKYLVAGKVAPKQPVTPLKKTSTTSAAAAKKPAPPPAPPAKAKPEVTEPEEP